MLDVPIAQISLPNMPLADAVQLVSAMSNLPVSFDPDAMEELGVSLHDPISIEVAKSTVGKTLEEIAAKRNMASVVENGQILLTSTAEHRESLRPVRFAVSDLTGGDAHAAADLAALVQRLVVPESWQANWRTRDRGSNARRPADHANRTRPLPDHRLLREAPRRPRPADEEPIGSEEVRPGHADRPGEGHPGPDRERERERAVVAGKHPRTVQAAGRKRDPHRPPRAGGDRDFRKHHRQVQGRQAAAGRGLASNCWNRWGWPGGPWMPTRCRSPRRKRSPRGWSWSSTPWAKSASAGQPPAALIERIKAGLPGAAWGEGGQGGAIYFDPPSQCLIVLQSQPVQRAMETLLTAK